MIYQDRDKLTIIEVDVNEEILSFKRLNGILLDRPSNVIYCENSKKLVGIITLGDILRADSAGQKFVAINTCFTHLNASEYMKARIIFLEKENINEIPVLNENGMLIGHWSRWDHVITEECLTTRERREEVVALVYPCNQFQEKMELFQKYSDNLRSVGISVKCITYKEILEYINEMDFILFVDEDERRTFSTLYLAIYKTIDGHQYKKFQTCKYMYSHTKIDESFMDMYLKNLQREGVKVFNLIFEENAYFQKMSGLAQSKLLPETNPYGLVQPSMYHDFYGGLYSDEETDMMAHLYKLFQVEPVSGRLKNCKSRFYNVKNGERTTVGQPGKYRNTIYFIGPCYIYGHFVEDKNTIESFLQAKLNDKGYDLKVSNYGSPGYDYNPSMEMCMKFIMGLSLTRGDMVIFHVKSDSLEHIPKINLTAAVEGRDVQPGWIVDKLYHCNDKMNAIYAEYIFKELRELFSEPFEGQGEKIQQDENVVKKLYLNKHFLGFDCLAHKKTGSIVMNCNPFTYGHRYLIEQALRVVDFLIIFVVEENRSLFSFDERFAMVCEGTRDLENVMVVPSGPFILSQTTFPEYFIKTADEDIVENVEKDVTFFAENIAPQLNITYRFVGEEPEDAVTNEYNLAMKRILPEYGMQFVEIPRKVQDGRYISASFARKCLINNDLAEFKKVVPKSTVYVLFGE